MRIGVTNKIDLTSPHWGMEGENIAINSLIISMKNVSITFKFIYVQIHQKYMWPKYLYIMSYGTQCHSKIHYFYSLYVVIK